MNEEKKIEIVKEFLNRYGEQKIKTEWQNKKLNGLSMLLLGSENADETVDDKTKLYAGWEAAEKKYVTETVKLCQLYTEITDALDMIDTQEERDILYGKYIELHTLDEVANLMLQHPKTVSRKHKTALLQLYDIIR